MALRTTEVRGPDDIREFFDRLAPLYRDRHGSAKRLLRHRLRLIRRLIGNTEQGFLVEIGCGTGAHLFALAGEFRRAHGTDLSPAMIRQAEETRLGHAHGERISLSVDPAEALASVRNATVDMVLCVGAFEHMPDKAAVLGQVRRVLRRGGVFVCLTPNADYVWYTKLAPRLGFATTHLSSDRFVSESGLQGLLEGAGLEAQAIGHWTFIPRGDMPGLFALVLAAADVAGRVFRIPRLRGGLYCRALRP